MTQFFNIFFSLTILVSLTSCGGTTNVLTKGEFTGKIKYNVNSYYGCCGCDSRYFTITAGKTIIEQVVYSYNCYSKGKPTKFIFKYSEEGELIGCEKYVATVANDFTQELNEQERQIFSLLETTELLKANYTTVSFSEIKGFRRPVEGEVTHIFPFVRKGSKLPVN